MTDTVIGGQTTYGHVVGILMTDSTIPRIPGDPGHAETFGFPVVYDVLKNFPFEDLVNITKDNTDILIERALALQKRCQSDRGRLWAFRALSRRFKTPPAGSVYRICP